MKIGDHVYVVGNHLTVGLGIAGRIAGLDDTAGEVAVRLVESGSIVKVKTWDILPARLYTRAVLYAAYRAVQDLERELDSILRVAPPMLMRKLIDYDLCRQTARECVDLFDPIEWETSRQPLYRWLRRIRDYYHPIMSEARAAA
ncbi:MAG TPA: hypothetical protein VF020_07210 [Chthoniobacterales bacterium]